MGSLFCTSMNNERTIAIALVLVIIVLLSVLIVVSDEDIFGNLFEEDENGDTNDYIIESGDYVDAHYIAKYENGGIFAYSYDNLTGKTGENTLKIFVTTNSSDAPDFDYEVYSNMFSYYNPYIQVAQEFYFEELIEGLIGSKEGDIVTIGPIDASNSSISEPEIGDQIDFSNIFLLNDTFFSVYNKVENQPMLEELKTDFGDITTDLYYLRQDFNKVGDVIDSQYTFWTNSSVITKINETLIWIYVTPTTDILENFTWIDTFIDDYGNQVQINYPTNTSAITALNESTIVVTHTPEINSTIDEYYVTSLYGSIPGYVYTVENVTDDKINASYQIDSGGNLSYTTFNRTTIIQRNQTETIIASPIPSELLEAFLYNIRATDPNFTYGCSPFQKPIYLEVEVVEINKP